MCLKYPAEAVNWDRLRISRNLLIRTGGKILLNKATLRLKKGRRYGLCGANGVGKV